MKIVKTDYYQRVDGLKPGSRIRVGNCELVKTTGKYLVDINSGEMINLSNNAKIQMLCGSYIKLGDLCVGDIFTHNFQTYLVTNNCYLDLETYEECYCFGDLDEENEVYVYNPNYIKLSIKL